MCVTKFSRTIIINRTIANALPVLVLTLVAHATNAHVYHVEVDATLATLDVETRLSAPATALVARSREAQRYLDDVRTCDGAPLNAYGRRLPTNGSRCIRYTVDLHAAARSDRRNAGLASSNVVVSPSVWLWRPEGSPDSTLEVRFVLDDAAGVSVPWARLPGEPHAYRPHASPRASHAPAVFGRFAQREIELGGARLRIAVLESSARGRARVSADQLFAWVVAAAGNVTHAYGRLPNPSPQIVVIPVRRGAADASPVPFGRVVRDGGETIEFFIDDGATIDAFYDDWTATHEFSHLMLPYLHSRHRWISEGFASYYQNLLMARGGRYEARRAWQKLYDGFERGRRSGPGMSPNEAAERRSGGLMKMYWSGAALALMADVELRRRSGGRESLDGVLDELSHCCVPAGQSWSGPDLFEKLDSFLDEPLFMPLYRRYADRRGFPEVRDTLTALGVGIRAGRVELDDNAELASIRIALTGT